MTYLLDLNALIALSLLRHQFHQRVNTWLRSMDTPAVATCSVPELGLIRVLSQPGTYTVEVSQARDLLLHLRTRQDLAHTFLPDANDISRLPAWVTGPKQVTDGHLLQLAATHKALLATLDQRIPGAFFIPPLPSSSQP